MERTSPAPRTYGYDAADGFLDMQYSGAGELTAQVSAVDINLSGSRGSTSGCERADFKGFPSGHIALIQRGTCGFREKVDNAVAAGAAGVVVFNQGDVLPGDDRQGLFGGTLEAPQAEVPVISTTFDNGAELAGPGTATLRLAVDATATRIKSFNITADTDGRADRKVVVGIPAGGLFTGAEDLKTPEEAAVFGGTAGAPHEPCYHAACDTIADVNATVLDQMADAVAHATLAFAQAKSALNATAGGGGSSLMDLKFKADRLLK